MPIRVHQQISKLEHVQKFVQSRTLMSQIDVVLANSEEVCGPISALHTPYYRSTVTFAQVFSAFDAKTSTLAVSLGSKDVWYIDHRAILTLSVTPDAYESLGIVAVRLGSIKRNDIFLITLDLHDSSPLALRTRECLQQWDARRAKAGKDGWDVLVSSPLSSDVATHAKFLASPNVRAFQDVRIPCRTLPPFKSEDSQEELSMLFEWVGLASLGSQRLRANDFVNPYVASCFSPASWHSGSLTHVRWTGLLTPSFVQSLLDTCLQCVGGLVAISVTPMFCDAKGVWTFVASAEMARGPGLEEVHWILAECSE